MVKKYTLRDSLLTEFLGTALLLGAQVGAAYQLSTAQSDPRSVQILGIAVVTALALAVAITIGGSISGGHFNPAVTIGLTITGHSPVSNLVPYIVSQLVGGFVGVTVANLMWGRDAVITTPGQAPVFPLLLSELIVTAGLVGIVIAMVRRSGGAGLNWLVPTYLLSAVLLTPTGSMANPAVAFGHIFNGSVGTSALLPFIGVQLVAGLAVAGATLLLAPKATAKKK